VPEIGRSFFAPREAFSACVEKNSTTADLSGQRMAQRSCVAPLDVPVFAIPHGVRGVLECRFERIILPMVGLEGANHLGASRATAESGEAAPGIVAHPPFSMNEPRSQLSNITHYLEARLTLAAAGRRRLQRVED
jgi:hypothetical protein